MNRITRMLTMTGLGVFAAVSVGTGPAMATSGGSQTPAKSASSAAKAKPAAPSRTRIVDIYPSRGSCNFAGRLGERRGDWDDYVCYRTRGGWALRISFDSWGSWNDWDNDDWRGPWGIHGIGGGGFRDDDRFRGNRFRDDDRFRFRDNDRFRGNGGGFRPGRPGGFRPGRPGGFRPGRPGGFPNFPIGNGVGAIPIGPGGPPAPGTVSP